MKTEQQIKEMRDKFAKEKDNPKWMQATREMTQLCWGILEWVLTDSEFVSILFSKEERMKRNQLHNNSIKKDGKTMIDGSHNQLKLAIERTLKQRYHLNDIADFSVDDLLSVSVDDLLSDIMTDVQNHIEAIKSNIIRELER